MFVRYHADLTRKLSSVPQNPWKYDAGLLIAAQTDLFWSYVTNFLVI